MLGRKNRKNAHLSGVGKVALPRRWSDLEKRLEPCFVAERKWGGSYGCASWYVGVLAVNRG